MRFRTIISCPQSQLNRVDKLSRIIICCDDRNGFWKAYLRGVKTKLITIVLRYHKHSRELPKIIALNSESVSMSSRSLQTTYKIPLSNIYLWIFSFIGHNKVLCAYWFICGEYNRLKIQTREAWRTQRIRRSSNMILWRVRSIASCIDIPE